ncbi:MAG: hypothetical protein ACJ79E_21790, partial [Anaeromyxobacteraceae bacterium]
MSRIDAGRRLGAAVVAVSLAAFAQAALAASAPLALKGPPSPVHPFPLWYQDASAPGVKLEPCLDPTRCVLPATSVAGGALDTAAPFVYPTNFPSKVIYGYANIDMPVFDQRSQKVQARGLTYTAQLLATFATPGAADPGPQVWTEISFVTNVTFPPSTTYTITHPYGVFTLDSDAFGNLCLSRNQGGRNPCNIRFPAAIVSRTPFDGVLAQNPSADPNDATLGTFLRQAIGAPAGFMGDGVSRGGITGSPVGQNFIRIEGPGVGTSPGDGCPGGIADCIEVGGAPPKNEGFVVAGKIFNPLGGPATQFWITDALTATPAGTIPRIDFSGTAGVPQLLTIRAVDANGNVDPNYTGVVSLASSDPPATVPLTAALSGGTGTFTVT